MPAAMSWKCPQCGMQNDDAEDACVGMCGHMRLSRLVLTAVASGHEMRFNVDTEVGRTGLQKAAGEEAKFASQPQFKVFRASGKPGWLISHCATATNPTFLNGKAVGAEAQLLRDSDTVSIGPKRLVLKVRTEKSI